MMCYMTYVIYVTICHYIVDSMNLNLFYKFRVSLMIIITHIYNITYLYNTYIYIYVNIILNTEYDAN